MKILMVCLGNICRSPLAEGILRHELELLGKTDIIVDSAGTLSYHVGHKADSRAIKVAKKYGVDITKHRGQVFTKQMFEDFDKIYVMDKNNYFDVMTLAKKKSHSAKIDYLMNVEGKCPNQEVPDPWYGEESDFEQVFQQLQNVCKKLAETL